MTVHPDDYSAALNQIDELNDHNVQLANERDELLDVAEDLLSALARIMEYAHEGASVRDVDPTEQPQFVKAKAALESARAVIAKVRK